MPKPRFSGGSVSMRCSSSQMLPPESCMSPAMQLSAVDLPQPEGPSRQINSPRLTVSVSSSSALNALPPAPANWRVTRSSLSSLKSCFMQRSPGGSCRRLPVSAMIHRVVIPVSAFAGIHRAVIPAQTGIQPLAFKRHWIPAFAGMTQLFPIAATLRVWLSDSCVTSSFVRRPAGPRYGTPRPAPWARATACAETARARPRTRDDRIP